MFNLGKGPPTEINEEGVKWWKDIHTTVYATRPNENGTSLANVRAWLVEEPSGERSRVLTRGQQVLATCKTLDELGTQVDILKLLQESGYQTQ